MSNNQSLTTQLIMIAAILVIGFFGARLIGNLVFNKLNKGVIEATKAVEERYSEGLSEEKDANKLVKSGVRQIEINQFSYAIITLKKATEVEPKYRDAWVYLGYAYLRSGKCSKSNRILKRSGKNRSD